MKREEVQAKAQEYLWVHGVRGYPWSAQLAHGGMLLLDEVLTDFSFLLFEAVFAHNERLIEEFKKALDLVPTRPILLPASSVCDVLETQQV